MNKIFFIAMVLIISATSCTKKDITPFIALPAINFIDTNQVAYEYSFLGNPNPDFVYQLPVRIVGNVSDKDRTFNAVAVKDSATNAPDELYEIIGGYVKAGQFRGFLQVKLKNAPQLASSKVSLRLKLTSSNDFIAGTNENNTFIIRWTGQVVLPSWSIFKLYFTTAASTNAYNLIVYTTGLKTLSASEHARLGVPAAQSLATAFGDYVKQWNLDHPNNILMH
ncbi:MAG: DUF4843 domain-containing protein, partial [Chitinophagaceae bacterium]|nr:DUF4843 domain-containing protein [Chitinophagaceae bacterium]